MLDGIVVYRVLELEQRLFERELVRRQQMQEASRSARQSSGVADSRISKLAASIRATVRTDAATKDAPAAAYVGRQPVV